MDPVFWTVPSHTWYMCSNDDMADDDGSVDYLITPGLNVAAQMITLILHHTMMEHMGRRSYYGSTDVLVLLKLEL